MFVFLHVCMFVRLSVLVNVNVCVCNCSRGCGWFSVFVNLYFVSVCLFVQVMAVCVL